MANNYFRIGILVIILEFGLVGFANCQNREDQAINGTWIIRNIYNRDYGGGFKEVSKVHRLPNESIVFKDGNFEWLSNNSTLYKGTYTISGEQFTMNTDHIHGRLIDLPGQFIALVLDMKTFDKLKWYSKDEFKTILRSTITEISNEELESIIEMYFFTRKYSYDISLGGDVLTLTIDSNLGYMVLDKKL